MYTDPDTSMYLCILMHMQHFLESGSIWKQEFTLDGMKSFRNKNTAHHISAGGGLFPPSVYTFVFVICFYLKGESYLC